MVHHKNPMGFPSYLNVSLLLFLAAGYCGVSTLNSFFGPGGSSSVMPGNMRGKLNEEKMVQ